MPLEKHDTCLGNAPRERKKKEVKLTFQKHRSRMLRKKEHKMGDI
jgi:hypothetical protein